MGKDLDRLINAARARLQGAPPSSDEIEAQRQQKALEKFRFTVNIRLDPRTLLETYPQEWMWLDGAPAVRFYTDHGKTEQQEFLLRQVKDGFELSGPARTVKIPADRKLNDRLLVAMADQMEAVKRS